MSTMPFETVKKILAERGAQTEEWLAHCAETLSMPPRLREAMRYSLLAGGKRLRPVLCLSTAALSGLPAAAVLPFAGALELIHTYSLIHDDLPAMDDDDLRRGRPSCHKAFDEATAILAGDALLTDAFFYMASCPLPPKPLLNAIRAVASAAGSTGMVGGQIMDMNCTGRTEVTIAELRLLHALKTGAMFRVACTSGGLLAGAPEPQINALQAFGEELGIMFQIVDDILDETADTSTLGKPAGSDAAQGKTTYPSLLGLEKSRELARIHGNRALDALSPFAGTDADFLRGLTLLLLERSR